VTSGDKTVTFTPDTPVTTPTIVPSLTAPGGATNTTTQTTTLTQQATAQPTATVIAKKTTYSPLPAETALIGLGIAALALAAKRKD
jgi:hypothetical protein